MVDKVWVSRNASLPPSHGHPFAFSSDNTTPCPMIKDAKVLVYFQASDPPRIVTQNIIIPASLAQLAVKAKLIPNMPMPMNAKAVQRLRL